jgi:hypothetical protein
MILRLSDGSESEQPDAEGVRAMLDRLHDDVYFAVLSRGPEHYVQAYRGDDGFALEVRDGPATRHFERVAPASFAEVDRLFVAYLADPAPVVTAAQGPGWRALAL